MFMTMKNLGLTNRFLVYIIPAIVQPFNIIMVKTYVESLPASLQEAARGDGAVPLDRADHNTLYKILLEQRIYK